MDKNSPCAKILQNLLAVFFLALLIYFINYYMNQTGYTAEDIKNYITSFGIWAPLVFIILFTLVPLTLFPDALLAIAGGMVFGLFYGFIYTMIGAACGATLAFMIARLAGNSLLKKLKNHNIDHLQNLLNRNGFWIVLYLRLIPLIPFDIISYGAGLARIKYRDFILATLLGIIPGVLVYVNLGDKSLSIGSTDFYIALALLIGLTSLAWLFKRKIKLPSLEKTEK
ncbi:Uncharacterized membrane protein YdjX, TVP38/TMEM64 family, SNARE-associated domain [Thermosyntropha lipolytica DSM 11003]|uniref:TVP38/TMEM64 family membrane protein n=1 Tax=Thermosyntropha lipolytica DSM 11003 TaxID=1123382 RepID=A0A1M5MEW1_9FIRM|nr:TVP38/TMEM64 family protein [Thermosyntropha lipolytica]SHG75954.1 Uncharacterized membrane protein YdjX, TVP38/TMEM64 family, SNARE-associated domain [Thermosyntropha lipolytica DSM 11003]